MRIFLSSVLMFIFSVAGFSQKVLTLNEAINIALQRNTDLQQAKNNIESYESNVKASYGNLLPSLGASGTWQWQRSESEAGTFPLSGGGFIDLPKEVRESRSYNVGLGTNWTIFDGLSNIAAVSQDKNILESARFSLERLKQTTVFQTISYYYEILNNRQLLKVKEDDVIWNQKNLETITERNKLGAVTLADVYAQQVRAGNAELAVIQTKNSLETATSNLLYYLGLDVFENYSFPDSLSVSEQNLIEQYDIADIDELSSLVKKAMISRPDYQSAKLNLESSLNGMTIARGGHYPRLSNTANFSTSANRMGDLFESKNYSVGLTLSIPIFSGFSIENRVQLAEVNYMNTELELNNIEREIKRGIQKTWLDLQAADKGLEVSRRNVLAAEENRRIEQEKYNLGSGTLLNVLIANSEFTNAQTNFINAQFAFITLSEQLKYQIGVLETNR